MVGKKRYRIKGVLNEIVETLGSLKSPFQYKNYKIGKAQFLVVADGLAPILGPVICGDLDPNNTVTVTKRNSQKHSKSMPL